MKTTKPKLALTLIAFSLLIFSGLHSAFAQTTAFTYQGRLNANGSPANGNYDMTIYLSNSEQMGHVMSNTPPIVVTVPVTNGLFTVELDFGNKFDGNDRWLEINVRTNGGGAFTPLIPRQKITPTPYVIYSANAGVAGSANSVAAGNIVGTLSTPQLPASVALLSSNVSFGTVAGTNFSGNGVGLTNLQATNLTGTIADARLSTNVAQLSLPSTARTAIGTPVPTMGNIISINLVDGGTGYLTPPAVVVNGDGVGAVVTALMSGTPPGAVTGFSIQNQGTSYTEATLTIAPPPSNGSQTFAAINNFSGANTFNNPGNTFSGNGAGLTGVNAATLGSLSVSNFWKTSGNNDTTAGTHFLGTTDDQPLELKVNGARALRLEPNTIGAPNVIGGSSVNFVASGIVGAVIAGGGATNSGGLAYTNSIAARFASVGGGAGNTIKSDSSWANIDGGLNNTIQTNAVISTIGGGTGNSIHANGYSGTIPGGDQNSATNFAFAAGHRAKAINTGAFVWADSSEADFASTVNNQFLIRAAGGVSIGTSVSGGSLYVMNSNSVAGNNNTAAFSAPNIGPNFSHIQYGSTGDWYIRSSTNTGKVILQDTGGNVGIGTSAPAEALDVRGNVKMGASGQFFATGASENVRFIRGTINDDSSIAGGSGFTASHPSTGVYVITFATPFTGTPTITVTAQNKVAYCTVGTFSTLINTRSYSGVLVDDGFSFIAIGPR